jgi:hypothetical protein
LPSATRRCVVGYLQPRHGCARTGCSQPAPKRGNEQPFVALRGRAHKIVGCYSGMIPQASTRRRAYGRRFGCSARRVGGGKLRLPFRRQRLGILRDVLLCRICKLERIPRDRTKQLTLDRHREDLYALFQWGLVHAPHYDLLSVKHYFQLASRRVTTLFSNVPGSTAHRLSIS